MKSTLSGERHGKTTEGETFANSDVLEFYKTLPFNFRESVQSSIEAIRSHDPRLAYPVLTPLLHSHARVLDLGCGAGWLANSLSYHCGCAVTGIDFNPVAVERAKQIGAALGLATTFEIADLFLYEPKEQFDLAVSLGVLHHTENCAAAVRHLCDRFVKPGGHVFVGLYHTYGRQPFLDHFHRMRERGASEQELFARYKELHSSLNDDTLLLSWFRDQVLHPRETQHTMREMMPILADAGMELISTSINQFGAITSFEKLYAEEKALRATGESRLKENQYFTGFFVFLARKNDTTQGLDAKPYIEYDPQIGYRYSPNVDLMLPRPGGGNYHFQTNSRGIRSSREYSFAKLSGTRRILLCGDSMPAGQFVSNRQRLSEQLERRMPGLEVINLSLEGSGTDQQLLLYESVGVQYEHDLVILMPFLSNLRRNMVSAREGFDAKTGAKVLHGKPRFDLHQGQLELRNVPVPKYEMAAGETEAVKTDAEYSRFHRPKAKLSTLPGMAWLKQVAYHFVPWEPFTEFRDADSAEWRLMAAIVKRFKKSAGNRPLLIAPTFYDSYVRYRMSRNYLLRFKELEHDIPGVHVLDLLPHFKRLGADAWRCFQIPYDMHFSAYGHLVLADVLERELARYLHVDTSLK
jgi:2-polyprenyl-3-methyl-5-hydroxy-6-metoxy-1,4-benzoquinol methylase